MTDKVFLDTNIFVYSIDASPGQNKKSEEAMEYLHYMAIFKTVQPDFHMIVSAIRLHQKHAFSFLDALILQAAKTAGCSLLVTEDLQDGFALPQIMQEISICYYQIFRFKLSLVQGFELGF